MEQNVTLDRAIDIALELTAEVAATSPLPLSEAFGKVLAENVYAARSVPPFDRSPFDGYAFIAADSASAPVTLRVLGEVAAGSSAEPFRVTPGTAVKILTGAPVPSGADVIAKFEETRFDDGSVTLLQPYRPGNIVPTGEDVRAGELIAERGERLSPAIAGMLAAQGFERVSVYRKPIVGVISTGNELGGGGEGKIYDSNRYTLCAAVEALGAEARFLGTARDSADAIADLLTDSACDMLITTGGMGRSDHDFTLSAFERLGAKTAVHNCAFMPGGTLAVVDFGVPGFLLSGNPAAAMITFCALIRPCVRKLSGLREHRNRKVRVTMKTGYLKAAAERARLLTGTLDFGSGIAEFTVTERGKGTISAFRGIDAIAVYPAGGEIPVAGAELEAFLV